MHLYALTLQRATSITAAIYGNFSAPKQQEIVVARGKLLELLRPDDSGKLQSVHVTEVFGIIRSIQAFRLLGGNRDYIIVGSDSGKITVLEFKQDALAFARVHCEVFGKSGCRRIVPGQYLAVDPRGRAVMIGACEKQKLVYTLNRDSSANLTISSPLEAHKSHTLCFDLIGVDVGFDNPIFAALEVDYDDIEPAPPAGSGAEPLDAATPAYTKVLTYYELDLGLNNVTRKWSDAVDQTSNMLVAIPGGDDGPGGVLVCSENFVTFRAPGQDEVRCLLPRRSDLPANHGLLVVAHAVHRQKDLFFVLLQTELGDLYKISLKHAGASVSELTCRYFDSIPTTVALVIMRNGFLFAASEAGNHLFYQFQGIGDDADSPTASSLQLKEGEESAVLIEPRPLRNLLLVDELENIAPLTDLRVADVAREGSMQLCALTGRGPRSTVRVLRHGLAVAELAVSELPGTPTAVWTVRASSAAQWDSFIVVSFVNATLVLSIGETVEEVTDSGLLGTSPTLAVQLLDGDSLCQVHPSGLRNIKKGRAVSEWCTPNKVAVTRASANARQVLVALSGGELIYFELDALNKLVETDKKDIGQEVSCLDLGPVPAGRQRCRFAAVGSWDNYVRILSLDPDDCMQVVAMKGLPAPIESCMLLDCAMAGLAHVGTIVLAVGLSNGVLMRTTLDAHSAELQADTTTVFCGKRAVRLAKVVLGGKRAMLALSSRPWAGYGHQGRFQLTPLSYDALEHASAFTSEQCAEGIVAVAGNSLRIFAPERLGEVFHHSTMQVRYTPRRMTVHPPSGLVVVVEADHHAYGEALKSLVYAEAQLDPATLLPADAEPPVDEETEADAAAAAPLVHEAVVGTPRAPDGRWGSCVRVLDCAAGKTLFVLELPENEAAFSVCAVPFRELSGEYAIVVGSCKDLELHPRKMSSGFIRVYRLGGTADGSASLALLHETPTEDVPYALASFQGRLLAGIGKTLRLYDLGKKRLLRRCEARNLPVMVQSILVLSTERIVVGDLAESFQWMRYRAQENAFHLFADETVPRWLTSACPLDESAVAGADKFGNVFVCRLPPDSDAQTMDVGSVADGWLGGAACKAEEIVQYHVGELVVSLQKERLSAASHEVILFATNMGAIGAMLPVRSRDEIDFLKHLEMHMRQEAPPLCGRDHLFFRSSFFPVKDVTDGDLCEQFSSLPAATQRSIAQELDRTPSEVVKKLEDLHNCIL